MRGRPASESTSVFDSLREITKRVLVAPHEALGNLHLLREAWVAGSEPKPTLSQPFQVTLGSYDEELLFVQHVAKEMVSRGDFLGELLLAVHARIDRAAKPLLGLAKPRDQRLEAEAADDHEIDITLGGLSGAGHGTVDESDRDQFLEGAQGLAQRVEQSRGLRQEAA